MLSIKIAGVWLSSLTSHGPVTLEYGLHGSEAASWEVPSTFRHPLMRGNKPVEIYDGGFRVWIGTLVEPGGDGQYSAIGIWRQAVGSPALTSAGAPTTIADTAIAEAYNRGEITWGYFSSIRATEWATTPITGDMDLAQLLDGVATEQGLRWSVSPNYVVSLTADPTTPRWHVPHAVAGEGLTPAEDEFFTHIVARYLSGASTWATVTVGSADAAAVFGRRTGIADLTPMGIIGAPRATSVATGMFLQSGARMGWAQGLTLNLGQIVTPGGIAAPLAQVQAMQMVRLEGVLDTSRPYLLPSSLDVVIGSSRYSEAEKTITISPVGYAPRTLGDILTVTMEDAA